MIPGHSRGNAGLSTGYDWAAIASTPHNHGSRFAVLTTDDDGDSADGQPFTVVDRRRSAKRARQRSSPPQATATQLPSQHPRQSSRSQPQQRQQQQQQQLHPARRAPIVYGKAPGVSGTNIAAAKIMRKKAVFCLDNIAVTCSVSDVCDYVSRLSVSVLSCFQVKPRRQRDDADGEDITDRVAFRLCIYDDDREKLLNPNAWPNSVTISPWYFQKPGAGVNNNLSRAGGGVNDPVALAGASAARPATMRSSSGCTPDTIQSAGAAVVTAASSEALPDESMGSNDETILTPVNADNDGN